jgi:nitroimidazol reductase NimA-like FMN-containing flavoprotein (pyridoxamine 5'-phosphate oxidase superfamily)
MSVTPRFRDLTDAECHEILARNHVGRIAYALHEHVNVQPIGYVMHEGWLACRTEEGSKLLTLRQSPYVAFEVDEVEGPFDWRSVIVQGSVYEDAPPTPGHAATLAALREVMPDVFTSADPVPERDVLFRVHIREMTGRTATTTPR